MRTTSSVNNAVLALILKGAARREVEEIITAS
jgi:hypothetical protein